MIYLYSKQRKNSTRPQYFAKIKWKREDGSWGSTKTGLFNSRLECLKEAERRESMKENNEQVKREKKTAKTVKSALAEFIDDLNGKLDNVKDRKNGSKKSVYKRAKTVYNKYIPANIAKMKVSILKAIILANGSNISMNVVLLVVR